MFKTLILKAQHNLSDARMEFMIRDQLSWMRFSSTTGTALARLRRPEKLQQVLEDMLGGAPSSCRGLARRLGANRMTVWHWRMRVLVALEGTGASGLGGIVEADEKFFRGPLPWPSPT